jgi:hypothetical protein
MSVDLKAVREWLDSYSTINVDTLRALIEEVERLRPSEMVLRALFTAALEDSKCLRQRNDELHAALSLEKHSREMLEQRIEVLDGALRRIDDFSDSLSPEGAAEIARAVLRQGGSE